ncbi:hypothetical protein NIES4106_10340 [Fischerella sp. NIES-4106]|nr:hypothetical protein NIES4106_10340 [Fischerella sp. NIES-4106]
MGIKTDEKTTARSKEEGCDGDANSRRGGDAGHKGESSEDQQKRVDRANSTKPSIFDTGTSITGGMLRQLISDYRDQVAAKKNEAHRLKDEIQRINDETEKLEARIKEFEALEQELEKQLEESS